MQGFFIAKFDLGGGDMKVATINIRSVKIHTPESLPPPTDGDVEERAAAETTTTTIDTNITNSVSILVVEAPGPYPLYNETFRVVVAHPVAETPVRILYPSTETNGTVVGAVIYHVMDASTVEMPPSLHFINLFHFLNLFQFL